VVGTEKRTYMRRRTKTSDSSVSAHSMMIGVHPLGISVWRPHYPVHGGGAFPKKMFPFFIFIFFPTLYDSCFSPCVVQKFDGWTEELSVSTMRGDGLDEERLFLVQLIASHRGGLVRSSMRELRTEEEEEDEGGEREREKERERDERK